MKSRRLYIPSVSDTVTLAKDWTFRLYHEYRNDSLRDKVGLTTKNMRPAGWKNSRGEDVMRQCIDLIPADQFKPTKIVLEYSPTARYGNDPMALIRLPKGTQLKVSRVYIRAGAREYNSITFTIAACPDKTIKGARFWAKLVDVNDMVIEDGTD